MGLESGMASVAATEITLACIWCPWMRKDCNMAAGSTKALSKRRGVRSVQPSARDVARPSSTNAESESFGFSKDKVIVALTAMLCGLSCVVMSQDQWFLAMLGAKRKAQENGISEDEFMKIQERIFELQQRGRETNPMKCLF